jgi:hypothetical protein
LHKLVLEMPRRREGDAMTGPMTPERAREIAAELNQKLQRAAVETLRQFANGLPSPEDASVSLIEAALLDTDRQAREEERERCAEIAAKYIHTHVMGSAGFNAAVGIHKEIRASISGEGRKDA